MKLNARQVESARPKEKPYKMADGGVSIPLNRTIHF